MVTLSPLIDAGNLEFLFGNEERLHQSADCLGVKAPAASPLQVFFPAYPPAPGESLVGGTLSIKDDTEVQGISWSREGASAARLKIEKGAYFGVEGMLLTYDRNPRVGDVYTLQFTELHLVNANEQITYQHGDPNVVFKIVSNPPTDSSAFPTCG